MTSNREARRCPLACPAHACCGSSIAPYHEVSPPLEWQVVQGNERWVPPPPPSNSGTSHGPTVATSKGPSGVGARTSTNERDMGPNGVRWSSHWLSNRLVDCWSAGGMIEPKHSSAKRYDRGITLASTGVLVGR